MFSSVEDRLGAASSAGFPASFGSFGALADGTGAEGVGADGGAVDDEDVDPEDEAVEGVLGAPEVVAVPVEAEGAVVEAAGAAGFASSLSVDPGARCSTGRSSLLPSSITGAAYFLDVSAPLVPVGTHVPSAIQVCSSCPGCVIVKVPCEMPVCNPSYTTPKSSAMGTGVALYDPAS